MSDVAALLALATAPLPPSVQPKYTTDPRRVRAFLRANGIETGSVQSIEVAALYQFFLAWGGHRAVRPLRFAADLRRHGFRRTRPKPLPHTERDRRVLLIRYRDVAERLIEWEREHPLTQEQRDIFNPRARWNR